MKSGRTTCSGYRGYTQNDKSKRGNRNKGGEKKRRRDHSSRCRVLGGEMKNRQTGEEKVLASKFWRKEDKGSG